jgi:hypothetical protein
MKKKITRAEFETLKQLALKRHWRWPAVFSTNSKGELWPYVCNGRTPELDRKDVRGLSRVLDEIASAYTAVREEGGRIFIKNDCVTWKTQTLKEQVLFVWEFNGPDQPGTPPETREEMIRSIRANKLRRRVSGPLG